MVHMDAGPKSSTSSDKSIIEERENSLEAIGDIKTNITEPVSAAAIKNASTSGAIVFSSSS
jgi:methyl coenzyme M reductase gamma subunit